MIHSPPAPPKSSPSESPQPVTRPQVKRSPNQWLLHSILVGGLLSLSLPLCPVALAGYIPPNSSKPTRRTTVTGTRGGCGTETATLTALAPVAHLAQTSSTHPTFAWHVPDKKPYPMELTLYENHSARRGKPIQKIQIPSSSPGIMQIGLDKTQPGLMMGKTYRWEIAMLCNPNRPFMNIWAEAPVELAELPTTVKTALSKTRDRQQRATLYANAGFWYDALTELLPAPTLKTGILSLLNDLVQLETPGQKAQLQQVIAIEQQKK